MWIVTFCDRGRGGISERTLQLDCLTKLIMRLVFQVFRKLVYQKLSIPKREPKTTKKQ